jgi:hypothetical protein
LSVTDATLDIKHYAIWWGIKRSKGDPFGKRKSKDGRHWLPTAGSPSRAHPIDIVPLFQHYCDLMGFCLRSDGSIIAPAGTPFFQQLVEDRPTGKAFTYAQLLSELRTELQTLTNVYKDLIPEEFGTHCFRRFGATLAKTQGVPDDLIQVMGGWASLTFQRYFIFDIEDKVNMNRTLLQ